MLAAARADGVLRVVVAPERRVVRAGARSRGLGLRGLSRELGLRGLSRVVVALGRRGLGLRGLSRVVPGAVLRVTVPADGIAAAWAASRSRDGRPFGSCC